MPLPVIQRVPVPVSNFASFTIPFAWTRLILNPLTTSIDVQFAFEKREANTSGKFATMLDGTPFTIERNDGKTWPPTEISFFNPDAATIVTVEVVVSE